MNKKLRQLFAFLLVLSLLCGVFPVAVAQPAETDAPEAAPAAQETAAELSEPPLTGFHHVDLPGYHLPAGEQTDANRDPLPSSFNAVDQGWVTPVKNQQPYGSCWAFGTLSPVESYPARLRQHQSDGLDLRWLASPGAAD